MAAKVKSEFISKLTLKKQAIEACQDSKGRVTPDAVIEAARNPESVLHGEFEWNVDKAAYQTWTETARRLIREVQLIVVYEDRKIAAPYYVSDPTINDSGYIATTRLAKRNAGARRALADELARITGAIQRAMSIAAAFGLVADFQQMLDLAVAAERRLSSVEDTEEFAQAAE